MKEPEYQTLLYEIENQVLHITLNRPEKRNALNEIMIRELKEIFNHFKDKDEIIGISVTGSGDSFCAGADLSYLNSLIDKPDEDNLKDSFNLRDMYWAIYNFPKPTIGLINGPAIAGGCGLMTVLDIAIATENAIFGYPEVKIGFVASIVSVFLIQAIGLSQAKKMLLTGETIDASEAEKRGLIQQVVRIEDLKKSCDEIFSSLRNNSPQALQQTKQLLSEYQNNLINQMLETACIFNADSRKTSDFKEGLQAFLQKRRPRWVKISS